MLSADVAVVGSGISGMLVARECLQQGLEVVVLERGGLRSHAEQLAGGGYETDADGARHNHETAPGTAPYPWDYIYGVGGASLHWSGHAPRLRPEDLRMHSTYGVMEDWPLSYEQLDPYYRRAEAALAVAGGPGGQPAHPLSPIDRTVAPLLEPFEPLPQAKPAGRRRPRLLRRGGLSAVPGRQPLLGAQRLPRRARAPRAHARHRDRRRPRAAGR